MRRTPAGPTILPRDRHAAARAVACFLMAGAAFVGSLVILLPGYAGHELSGIVATASAAVAMGVGGAACWRIPQRIPASFWVAVPVLSAVLIGALNLVSRDASAGAQLFFLWPVLYTATFLRGQVTYLVLASVGLAEVAVVFTLLAPDKAVSDALGLMTALTMATVVIRILRRRVDGLLTALETQALADSLTGLANRRAFELRLAAAATEAGRTGRPMSLLTIDLDHFKGINDRWGHAAGDAALQAVAAAMRAVCRSDDGCARLGGDEFAIMLDSDSVGAKRIAAALRAAIAAHTGVPGGPPTLSIGVASIPEHADTVEALKAASDGALYHAKAAGRNRSALAGVAG